MTGDAGSLTEMAGGLRCRAIKPLIGSEVQNGKVALLSGVHAQEIRDLLEQRGVLLLPKIDFSDEEQIAFTSIDNGSRFRAIRCRLSGSTDPAESLW